MYSTIMSPSIEVMCILLCPHLILCYCLFNNFSRNIYNCIINIFNHIACLLGDRDCVDSTSEEFQAKTKAISLFIIVALYFGRTIIGGGPSVHPRE